MLLSKFGEAMWWKSCRRNGFERGTASAAVNRENCVACGSVHRAAKRPYVNVCAYISAKSVGVKLTSSISLNAENMPYMLLFSLVNVVTICVCNSRVRRARCLASASGVAIGTVSAPKNRDKRVRVSATAPGVTCAVARNSPTLYSRNSTKLVRIKLSTFSMNRAFCVFAWPVSASKSVPNVSASMEPTAFWLASEAMKSGLPISSNRGSCVIVMSCPRQTAACSKNVVKCRCRESSPVASGFSCVRRMSCK